MRIARIAGPLSIAALISCSGGSTSTTPAAAPAPTVASGRGGAVDVAGAGAGRGATTGTGTAAGAGAAAPAPGRGGRGTPLTPEQLAARRDSIAQLRAGTITQLLATIAGKEDQPAGQVFKNVQLMKDVPAKAFLIQMDSVFGRALSQNCNSCHIGTDYASDSLARKRTARTMIDIMNSINKVELVKFRAAPRTPQITCITCHRGSGNTAPGKIVTY